MAGYRRQRSPRDQELRKDSERVHTPLIYVFTVSSCPTLSVCPSGFTDSGHGDVPAQLGVAVRRRDRLRRDPS